MLTTYAGVLSIEIVNVKFRQEMSFVYTTWLHDEGRSKKSCSRYNSAFMSYVNGSCELAREINYYNDICRFINIKWARQKFTKANIKERIYSGRARDSGMRLVKFPGKKNETT